MLVGFLVMMCIFLLTALGVSLYFNYKFGRIIIQIEDQIETSLDEFDVIYARISKILEIPVFFDSIEVRQVIADIELARETVLKVANNLVVSVKLKDEDDTQEKDG